MFLSHKEEHSKSVFNNRIINIKSLNEARRKRRETNLRMAENRELKVRNDPTHKLSSSGSVSVSEVKPRLRQTSNLSGKTGGFLWLQLSK